MEIIKSKDLNKIVCRLGGFHLLMSACGSLGNMMRGSGIEDAMEQVYGPNTIPRILSGKAIARSLRAHFLIEKALMTKLISGILPEESETLSSDGQTSEGLDKLEMHQVYKLENLISQVVES